MSIPEPSRGRPILPTSSSDFALPFSGYTSADDTHHILNRRFRRPSVLAPKAYDTQLHSPLALPFSVVGPRRRHVRSHSYSGEESDKERMWTDSSPSSGSECTPPIPLSDAGERERGRTPSRQATPQTPPRKSADIGSVMPKNLRRLSMPLKTPRVARLLAESRPPVEDEVRSEAAFQKFIASTSELPVTPHTPRAISDRGRYPEEVILDDDYKREETPSDDDIGESTFAFSAPGPSQPIPIAKRRLSTPTNNNGEDMSISGSPSAYGMDIDMISASPSCSSSLSQWRYTPPPTSSAMRSNKRKIDDRFDPYPTSSKRRAVSPPLREGLLVSMSPMNGRSPHPVRLPIAIPPNSTASSTASSPTLSNAYLPYPLPMASPTLRATMALSSPVLRPMARSGGLRRGEGEEKEVDGTSESVGHLTLA